MAAQISERYLDRSSALLIPVRPLSYTTCRELGPDIKALKGLLRVVQGFGRFLLGGGGGGACMGGGFQGKRAKGHPSLLEGHHGAELMALRAGGGRRTAVIPLLGTSWC